MQADSKLQICLFGSPRIMRPAGPLATFPTRRALYLLARLVIEPDMTLTRRELASALWPDEPYASTGPRLRQELVRLRKTLGEFADALGSDTDAVWILPGRFEADVKQFELACRIQPEDGAEIEAACRTAVALSARPFMEGVDEPWVVAERRRLNGLRYGQWIRLAEALQEQGRAAEAHGCLEEAMALFPNREAARRLAAQYEAHGGAGTLREPNLPTPRPIFGREAELERLRSWLAPDADGPRLVTILGPGGMGKTHLAVQICHAMRQAYADRVAFVDLTEIVNPALVPNAILKAIGQEFVGTNAPLQLLASTLPAADFLLVLDNVEQLAAAVGPVLIDLRQALPHLRIVATSRVALLLAEEYRLPLNPLPVPDAAISLEASGDSPALRLFMRAVDAAGVPQTTVRNQWGRLVEISRHLEGIPLALILAAPLLRTLGAADLLRALQRDYELLTTSSLDLNDRHRSLRNAISGSFELLSPQLRSRLSFLSVFRGGWTLTAASQVAELESARDTMDRLVDASLIERIGDPATARFRMLESVRAYSAGLLSATEQEALARRHIRWAIALTEPLAEFRFEEQDLIGLTELESELDNMREAIENAIRLSADDAFRLFGNLAAFFLYRSNGFEAGLIGDRLFGTHGDREPTEAMMHSVIRFRGLAHFFQFSNRSEMYTRALGLIERFDRHEYTTLILAYRGFLEINELDYDRSEATMAEIEARWQAGCRDHANGFAFRLKGYQCAYRGDLDGGKFWLRQAVAFYQASGDVFQLSLARLNLAGVAIESGDLDMADGLLANLHSEIVRIRFDRLLSGTYFTMGRLEEERGEAEKAIRYFETARAIWVRLRVEFQIGEQDCAIAKVLFGQGRIAEAGRRFAMAAVRWHRANLPSAITLALFGAAAAMLRLGEARKASRVLLTARASYERIRPRYLPNQQKFIEDVEELFHRSGPPSDDRPDRMDLDEAVALTERSLLPTGAEPD